MIEFSGIVAQPVSTVTAYAACKIDRVLVSARLTLYGDILYECLGGRLGSEELVPLSRDTKDFLEAWQVKERFDQLIAQKRRTELTENELK